MEQEKEWIAYVNGEYIPQSEVKLSIFDTCCAGNGYIFKLDQHIDFLLDNEADASLYSLPQ